MDNYEKFSKIVERGDVAEFLSCCGELNLNAVENKCGNNILSEAILNGKSELAVVIASTTGINLNHQNNYGTAPVHYAAYMDDLMVLKVLERMGAEMVIFDKEKLTPLKIASEMGHFRCENFLK